MLPNSLNAQVTHKNYSICDIQCIMPLSTYERQRVVVSIHKLYSEKLTLSGIVRKLEAENIYTTRQTVRSTIDRFQKTGLVEDLKRSGQPKTVTEEMHSFIDKMMADDDELTSLKLLVKIQGEFPGLTISERTVSRERKELGWSCTTSRYCQSICIMNMEKRLDWCTQMLENDEHFENLILTDESSIALERHRKKSYQKKGMPRKFKSIPKHPLKVHVWGGISSKGATGIVIFTGILTATRYAEILSAALLPFIHKKYPLGHHLYQDNDPKHTSRYIRGFFEENDIVWFKLLAESPDLNPIAMI